MESQQNESAKGSNVVLACTRKGATKREAIDMRNLLIQCMESVANNDRRRANSLLKQIRSRSSPSGNGSQRLAHYFSNSLEARLLGTGSLQNNVFSAISWNADVLKAYKLCLSSFPFMETSYFFSAQSIMDLAQKADAIHIIHFGIFSGLQWPPLIQRLSTRPGGPPKLRITGIDLPVVGSWPGSRVKETGWRLANYCKRFSVPFQYNGFEQNWETISVEDLGIEKGYRIMDFPFSSNVKDLSESVERDSAQENELCSSVLRGRKSLHREESDLEDEMRSNKHFADCPHESVLREMFAKVSIMSYDGNEANEENMESQQNESAKGSNVVLTCTRKRATKREAVDMRSLLIQCMESVANNDYRRANSLLRQIRSRSSPSGDGSQRLAHYFSNSLEARLLGIGSLQNKVLSDVSAISLLNADVLKAHKLCLSSSPFMETSYFFSAQSIMDLAQKADAIHIIHFGIIYGLHWLPLIQRLSTRPGGPPKLRITGIDLPVV
ncbi:hypothetical protein C3L33_06999, partial [Rhododendron williamsianum]